MAASTPPFPDGTAHGVKDRGRGQWQASTWPAMAGRRSPFEALTRPRPADTRRISSCEAVLSHVAPDMVGLERETVRALFLNARNDLIADETVAEGSINRVEIYPREVIRRALGHNATAMILVHNHPSGDPLPSEADVRMTHTLHMVCQNLDLVLHDHIIVAEDGWFSFLANRILARPDGGGVQP